MPFMLANKCLSSLLQQTAPVNNDVIVETHRPLTLCSTYHASDLLFCIAFFFGGGDTFMRPIYYFFHNYMVSGNYRSLLAVDLHITDDDTVMEVHPGISARIG